MPYEWLKTDAAPEQSGAAPFGAEPRARLHLWPYRSLPKVGFVWFIVITAALLAVPLFGALGSPVLWGLLPFALAAVWGVWSALNRSYRDGEIIEDLTIRPDRVTLLRQGPRGKRQTWEANPHWIEITLHPQGGPVPHYLTLRGAGRTVELGAFLSEDERIALMPEVEAALAQAR